MKAICIGRNYSEHVRELNNTIPDQPVVFFKNEDALIYNKDFVLPAFSQNIHYECELVFKIDKSISKDAYSGTWTDYISGVTLGIDLTARDIQDDLKSKSLPWELSKSFRQSGIIGRFIPITSVSEDGHFSFDFYKNGDPVQHGDSRFMIFSVDDMIRYVITYCDINPGDVLFTGTPSGVGKVRAGDTFKGILGSTDVLAATALPS